MSEFTYEVKESLGIISQGDNGLKKELKIISWNNKNPKYDLRDWAPYGCKKMGKGLTLYKRRNAGFKSIIEKLEME
jgi:hypothetical protein